MNPTSWTRFFPSRLNYRILCLAAFCPIAGLCQNGPSFSLSRTMSEAAKSNKSAEIAQKNLEISRAKSELASENSLPDLKFSANYSRITNIKEWSDDFSGSRIYATIPEIYGSTVSVSMPVYETNRLKNQKALAKLEHGMDEILLRQTWSRLMAQAANRFLSLYKLMRLQGFLDESLNAGRKRLKETQAQYKYGSLTRNEVLRAQLLISERRQDSLSNQRQIEVLKDELRLLVELPESQTFEPDTASLGEWIWIAEKQSENLSFELQAANQELWISEKQKAIAKSGSYPKIGIFANYGLQYPNMLVFPQQAQPYALGQIGIQLSYSATDAWRNRKNMRVAKQQIEKSEIEKEEAKDQMSHRLFDLEKQCAEIRQNIALGKEAVAFARDNLRIVSAKYAQQMVLVTELIDADNSLIQAQYRLASNQADLILKQIEIQYAKGQLNP